MLYWANLLIVKPVFTPEEMKQIDAEAHAKIGIETLIERAGFALARKAAVLLGGTYGKRVIIFAGKGNNGQDGRLSGTILEKRGVQVETVEVNQAPEGLPECDLVIDAAFGTGFHGRFHAPQLVPGTKVLAADLPSGLDGQTGVANGHILAADATLTFGAYKPGLFLNDGLLSSGDVELAPIGLEETAAESWQPTIHLVEDADLLSLLADRPRTGHKWNAPLYVLAGSGQMLGAASFVAEGAYRAGAGMVRLAVPGLGGTRTASLEAVHRDIPALHFADRVLEDIGRSKAMVIGPGLGVNAEQDYQIRRLISSLPIPTVIDADAVAALGTVEEAQRILAGRRAPAVMTPHDGEYTRLVGSRPGADRITAAVNLARKLRITVLLKGPTTVVADQNGKVLIVASGSQNLSTAGTGDVLAGIIGAFMARGLNPFFASALAAHVHGKASRLGWRDSMTASDLPVLVAKVLDEIKGKRCYPKYVSSEQRMT